MTPQETARQHAEVELAFANGAKIEECARISSSWRQEDYPEWDWQNYDYRIAPKPKKTVVMYQWLCKDACLGYWLTGHSEEPISDSIRRLDETRMEVEVEE